MQRLLSDRSFRAHTHTMPVVKAVRVHANCPVLGGRPGRRPPASSASSSGFSARVHERQAAQALPSLRLRHVPHNTGPPCRRLRWTGGTSLPHSQHTATDSAADSYTDGEPEAVAPGELRGVLSSGDEEGRWHDAMQRALMDSLQPPRAEHPSWWGKRYHNLQRRMGEVLESREAHYMVIGLVLLDLAIVLAELVLSSFYPTPELAPHLVHVAEEALSYTSIGILAIFTAELVAKLLVFGITYFTHSKWHLFDAAVVISSFALELSLRGVAQEVASLLIFFRLWRIIRIMHGVAEAMELNYGQEMGRLQQRVQQLETELSVSQQKVLELSHQAALLHVAAAAKGLDLHTVLTTAAETQKSLASTAQQSLLAAAAATASKGMELRTILEAADAELKLSSATAQQQLFQAAAAAAAAGTPVALVHSPPGESSAVAAQEQAHIGHARGNSSSSSEVDGRQGV